MTPAQYIRQLTALVVSGDDRAAVALSARWWPTLAPMLSAEELELVSGLMEGAESALELVEAEQTTFGVEPEPSKAATKGPRG